MKRKISAFRWVIGSRLQLRDLQVKSIFGRESERVVVEDDRVDGARAWLELEVVDEER